MKVIDLIFDGCTPDMMESLRNRAERVLSQIRRDDREYRVPIFFEFAGSPKAGKSTIIGIVSHFLRRMGFRVGHPAEGASLRLPPDLKNDLLAFNTWSAAYAVTTILEDSHAGDPDEIVILDRGLFDAVAWMTYLETQAQLSEQDRSVISAFLLIERWRLRQSGVFLFTADFTTSLARETECRLTLNPGRAMNSEFLGSLLAAYTKAATEFGDSFSPLVRVDTSFSGVCKPDFQRIAYEVADRILQRIEEISVQELLVTDPIIPSGMITDSKVIDSTLDKVISNPRFLNREQAEKDTSVQQLVPYALLMNAEGKYLRLRRRVVGERKELAGKSSILVGGHAERKDWDAEHPDRVFEQCIRREVSEEIIGLNVNSLDRIGLINDVRNAVGSKHLAVVYRVKVGGQAVVRRQSADKEFGRENLVWKSESEIRDEVADLDPWSQLVASAIFGAKVPSNESDPTLFMRQ